jgi:hypothetical protein
VSPADESLMKYVREFEVNDSVAVRLARHQAQMS